MSKVEKLVEKQLSDPLFDEYSIFIQRLRGKKIAYSRVDSAGNAILELGDNIRLTL